MHRNNSPMRLSAIRKSCYVYVLSPSSRGLSPARTMKHPVQISLSTTVDSTVRQHLPATLPWGHYSNLSRPYLFLKLLERGEPKPESSPRTPPSILLLPQLHSNK